MIAAFSAQGLVSLFVQILIVGAVCWLLWWLVGFINPPQPFAKILQVIIAVIAVIFLINALLSMAGHAFISF